MYNITEAKRHADFPLIVNCALDRDTQIQHLPNKCENKVTKGQIKTLYVSLIGGLEVSNWEHMPGGLKVQVTEHMQPFVAELDEWKTCAIAHEEMCLEVFLQAGASALYERMEKYNTKSRGHGDKRKVIVGTAITMMLQTIEYAYVEEFEAQGAKYRVYVTPYIFDEVGIRTGGQTDTDKHEDEIIHYILDNIMTALAKGGAICFYCSKDKSANNCKQQKLQAILLQLVQIYHAPC